MEEKTFTPLTTDEILDRAYRSDSGREAGQKGSDELQEQNESLEDLPGDWEGEESVLTEDEAEALAQSFLPHYGNS